MQSNSNILQVNNLSKFFGGLAAVSKCSLKMDKDLAQNIFFLFKHTSIQKVAYLMLYKKWVSSVFHVAVFRLRYQLLSGLYSSKFSLKIGQRLPENNFLPSKYILQFKKWLTKCSIKNGFVQFFM